MSKGYIRVTRQGTYKTYCRKDTDSQRVYLGTFSTEARAEEAIKLYKTEGILDLPRGPYNKGTDQGSTEELSEATQVTLESDKSPDVTSILIGDEPLDMSNMPEDYDPEAVTKEDKEQVERRLSSGTYTGGAVSSLMIFADLHLPYAHPDAIPFIKAVHSVFRPQLVANAGDEVDSHGLSFYPMHPALHNATTELKVTRQKLKELSAVFGETEVLCVESNHTSRMYRKAKSAGIPKDLILPYHEALGVPDTWEWAKNWKIPLNNGTNLLLSHTLGTNTKNAGMMSGSNIACGHFHKRGGYEWWTTHEGQEFFALSVPCLIDFDSPAYSYDENSPLRPNLGVAIVIDGVPYVVNMFTDKHGRWTGKLMAQVDPRMVRDD